MDARVDDFLNEINEIAPTKQKELPKSSSTNTCDWEECFDDTSGFPYYWNINTNEVTWEIPSDYKKWKSQQKKPKPPKTTEKHQIYKPETLLFPAVPALQIPDTIIYKIGESIAKPNVIQVQNEKSDITKRKVDSSKKVTVAKKKFNNDKMTRQKSSEESEEDEKITLISSYGGDTESEDEENDEKNENSSKSLVVLPIKELPNNKITSSSSSNASMTDQQEKVTGITLLASYGESDDEEDTNKEKKELKLLNTPPKISTLFPIQQLIDASQFDNSPNENPTSKKTLTDSSNNLTDEQRVYQRKRRIGLELPTNTTKKSEKDLNLKERFKLEASRTGFGFNSSNAEKYANFKSAGKMTFVKSGSETSLPSSSNDADLLKEKLEFLCEGKQEEISPVQIMLIQLETLQTARLAGCLQSTYLQKWLQETNEEISKLEKDSTPQGWILEWDRYIFTI